MEQLNDYDIYQDISARTGGEIYIGVVGPVRTGKSTFIKRFMDLMVLPQIEDKHIRDRTRDELPQSAAGRTIMTTEPKFVPKDAVPVIFGENSQVQVRLIDCVGYMVEGAAGHIEGDTERMVKTPWFPYEIPFTEAAGIGTRKVITDHSTIGIVLTTDGSFGDLPRDAFVPAEEQTIKELKELEKPFVVLLNVQKPYAQEAGALAEKLQLKYDTAVLPVNCEQLKKEDIGTILQLVLNEFPVSSISFDVPRWMELLSLSHPVKQEMIEICSGIFKQVTHMRDIVPSLTKLQSQQVREMRIYGKNLSDGTVRFSVTMRPGLYYEIISEYAGMTITGERQLMQTIRDFASMRTEYQKVSAAVAGAGAKGYGVVTPERNNIQLDEPKLMKHGNRFGVRMRAQASSIHMIRAIIETEIAPIVGSESQANDLISYIKESSKNSREGIWETNIFGKSIEQIVEDGIQMKISQMTDECQIKLQEALQKIINDSNGGMICIII
ncbi:MAG: stage IV sporulation protein A [Lachnospiraceae bacterium]|nr:stage IV sporulation protein A [Lachnospiraceae bacterium]